MRRSCNIFSTRWPPACSDCRRPSGRICAGADLRATPLVWAWSGRPDLAWALADDDGGRRPFFNRLCKWIDLPLLGPLLYKLNVNTFVVRFMAAGHVYAEPKWLSGDRLREKLAITRARCARSASIRFGTGELDPLETRDQFLVKARDAAIPILTIYGDQTPLRSRAEMHASRRSKDCKASVCR
jgi:hypothetical protein